MTKGLTMRVWIDRPAVAFAFSLAAMLSAVAGQSSVSPPFTRAKEFYDSGDYQAAVPLFEQALRDYSRTYGENHPNVGLVAIWLGEAHFRLGRFREAVDSFTRNLQICESRFAEDHLSVASARFYLGKTHASLGDIATAKRLLQQAIDVFAKRKAPENMIGDAYHWLGYAHFRNQEFREAIPFFREKAKRYERVSNDAEVSYGHAWVGHAYYNLGQYLDARESFRQAFDTLKETLPPNHLEQGWAYFNLGKASVRIEDLERGIELLRQSVSIFEKSSGKEHANVATAKIELGYALADAGRYKEGLKVLEEALDIRRAHFTIGNKDSAIPVVHGSWAVARLHKARGNYVECESWFQKAYDFSKLHLGDEHVVTSETGIYLAEVFQALFHQYERAEEIYLRIAELEQKKSLPSSSLLINVFDHLGWVYGNQRREEDAIRALEKSLTIAEKHYGIDSKPVGQTLGQLAESYLRTDQRSKASHCLVRAIKIKQSIYGDLSKQVALDRLKLGQVELDKGNFDRAERELLEAKRLLSATKEFRLCKT